MAYAEEYRSAPSAYPPGFSSWPQEKRNAWFADAARKYDESKHATLIDKGDGFDPGYEPPEAIERKPRFQIVRFDKIKPDSGAQYLVKGLLQGTGLAVVWGAPKCGKSFWTFDLLMHVAMGWEYRGRRVQQGTIVYCALEGAQGFRNRIEAFRLAKLSESDRGDAPFYLMATPLSLVRDRHAFIADISKQLGYQKPVVVCVDTLNRSLDGSESSDEDMAAYIRAADAIRDAFGCLVVVVHHCGHNGERPRGHSSLMGALDVQIGVRRDAADNIVAELELSKDGEAGLQFLSRLRIVEIGADEDGDAITSCVIEAVDMSDAPKPSARGARADGVESIRRAIVEAYARLSDGVEPSAGFGGAPVRKVSIDKLRDEVRRRGMIETDEAGKITGKGRTYFHRAKTDLIAAKQFIEADQFFWRLLETESAQHAQQLHPL